MNHENAEDADDRDQAPEERTPSGPDLPPGGRLITWEEYIELLCDSSLREADQLDEGFGSWSEQHAPTWKAMNRDEEWIRQRIETAQSHHKWHMLMREQGFTREQRRQFLRDIYAQKPLLYDLMLERERNDPEGPHISVIFGTTDDLVLRSVLRLLVYEAAKANYARYCRWKGMPEDEVARKREEFQETEDHAFILDLSTVEELELRLRMEQRMAKLLDEEGNRSTDEIYERLHEIGKELRAAFIEQYGFPPERATTPRIPVTIAGPVDPEEYHRLHADD